jgi:uncharacterized protein YbaR (Trm112 family)
MPAEKTQSRDFSLWADQLACPVCFQSLRMEEARVVCGGCGRVYPVVDSIPVLIAERTVEAPSQKPMTFDWNDGALAEGSRCYCAEEFFLAHEHWELVWLTLGEPEKTLLQALIQVTAAFHHLQRNNVAGTLSLLRRALRRLEAYPPVCYGVAVEGLRESLRAWISALEKDERPALPFPKIV